MGCRLSWVVFLSCLAAFSVSSSFAEESGSRSPFILEPYLSYEFGSLAQSDVTKIQTQVGKLGAKVGYRFSDIGAGFEYVMGLGKGTQGDLSGDYKPTDMGVFVTYAFLPSLDLYGAYLFSSRAGIQSDENSSKFSGHGAKLGISWRAGSHLTIGLEGIYRTYTSYAGNEMDKPLKGFATALSIGFQL